MRLCKGSSDIQTVDDWFQLAPPKKGALQWKDGRSAKELAKAWCERKNRPSPPEEFLRLLAPLVNADPLTGADGWPEHQLPIDKFPGEPPNIDLAIVSDGLLGRTVICVEAKADEPFGEYAFAIHDAAVKKIKQRIPTNALNRLLHLEENLLPETGLGLPGLAEIRYQLLTGTAAAIALAKMKQAPIAVFVVTQVGHRGRNEALAWKE